MTSALFSFSWSRAQVRSARGRALAPRSGCPARRSAAFLDRRRGCAIGGSLGLGACAAQIVLIGGIFAEPVVERVADFQACGADEVDALDRLVDSFAIENSSAQLLDPDAEHLAVLALDFSPAGFVLGKVGIFVRLVRHIAERGVLVALGSLALARSAHRESPCPPSACVRRRRSSSRRPGRSPCGRSRRTWSPCSRLRNRDRCVFAGGRRFSQRSLPSSLP